MTQMVKLAELIHRQPMSVDQLDRLLDRIVTEYAYNPNQPRHPAGDDQGGEWTASGGMVPANRLDPAHEERLKALRVPPKWKDVQLSVDPMAKLQATGIDDKGRKQRIYSALHSETQAAEKFNRLKAFVTDAPAIEHAALTGMQRGDHSAAAMYGIFRTGFRIGSDDETGGAVKAYGMTTLEGRHVQVHGDQVRFTFTGKKGVAIDKTITDRHLASFIRERRAGENDRIFGTTDKRVRDWMSKQSGGAYTPKDVRVMHGTNAALAAIAQEMKTPPRNDREIRHAFARVKRAAAEALSNTPAVAYASYIHPAVWSRLEKVK